MAQARFLEGPIAPFSSELQAQLPVRSGASDGGGEACPVPARAESWVYRWRDEAPGRGGALARFRAWFQTKTERPHPFLGFGQIAAACRANLERAAIYTKSPQGQCRAYS